MSYFENLLQTTKACDRTTPKKTFKDRVIPKKFIDIWLAERSFSPIIQTATNSSWSTIKSKNGKLVPLTAKQIRKSYGGEAQVLGKRFGKNTSYLMIDIDRRSPYHPLINGLEGWDPILIALEHIGLYKYLIVRSSQSGGYHIYFPLPRAVNTWKLTCKADSTLRDFNITIAPGICEIFPNRKRKGSDYNGHRLPGQRPSSYVVDEDLHFLTNDLETFTELWEQAAAGQDLDLLLEPADRKHNPINVEYTSHGQSNDILRYLANFGDRYRNLRTVTTLSTWMKETVTQLPGYDQYASEKSKHDIEQGNWCERWALCHLRQRHKYKLKEKARNGQYHEELSKAAHRKLQTVVQRIRDELGKNINAVFSSFNQLKSALNQKSRELFGSGFGTEFLRKNKSHWQNLLQKTTQEEKTEDQTLEKEAALATPGQPPQVNNEKVECQLEQTGFEGDTQPVFEVSKPWQPVKGDWVRICLPGTSIDGKKTLIRGKTRDALKRVVFRLGFRLAGCWHTLPIECLEPVLSASIAKPKRPLRFVKPIAELVLSDVEIKQSGIPKSHWLNALSGKEHRLRQEEIEPRIWQRLLDFVAQHRSD